ncbi:hypothetical protein, partial [Mesorhizobium sp.]|uniref:hypothetical protein n=1 Tax=Mesorhizobium sp. TaxID=1871066 RepID=UPI0025B9C4B9
AFDWSQQLNKSPSELEAALRTNAKCGRGRHSVPVDLVDQGTTIESDLFSPVAVHDASSFPEVIGKDNPRVDRDSDRRYIAEGIEKSICTIGREATATTYSFMDRVFRIELTFDRCESREEKAHSLLGMDASFVYARCDGVDLQEKDFDTALYKSIKARNTYGYNKQGQPGVLDFSWDRFMSGEYEAAERRAVFDLHCDVRNEARREVPPDDMSYRCLIDVNNSDPANWSATAMYEIFTPGVIIDDVSTRLTASRLFIDMPAEKRAIESMRPGLEAMLDGIKKSIAERLAAKDSSEGAVSNILGAVTD